MLAEDKMNEPITQAPTGTTMILRALARFPERTAFAWDGGSLTYRATLDLIGRLQAAMAAAGLAKGQTVAFLSANSAETWCAGVAASGLGLVTTWLHPLGALGDHLDVIEDAGASALIVDPRTHAQRGGELAAKAADRLAVVLTMGRADFGRDVMAAAEKIGAAAPVDLTDPDDYATINYTGGTTGKSKGAIRRHRSTAAMTVCGRGRLRVSRRAALPGGGADHPCRRHQGRARAAARRHGASPEGLRAGKISGHHRAREDQFHPRGADHDLCAARPSAARQDRSLLARAHPLRRLADVADAAGRGAGAHRADLQPALRPDRMLSGERAAQGRPRSATARAVRLLRLSHRFMQREPARRGQQRSGQGEAGEICVRAPHAMEQYWKRPEQTAETFKGGWLHTGDIARADERGYLYIVDRKKDMIVSGGFNIFPREVEDVLSSHPDVAMAAVIGVPHEKWGEAVAALIVVKAGTNPSAEALMQLVKDRKGGPHAPKQVDFVDSLPLTAVGKVDKKVLRAKYWAGQARQVG